MIRASRARVDVRQPGTSEKLLRTTGRSQARLAKGYDARARTCRSIHSLRLGRENISWYPLLMACEEYGGRPIHTFIWSVGPRLTTKEHNMPKKRRRNPNDYKPPAYIRQQKRDKQYIAFQQ